MNAKINRKTIIAILAVVIITILVVSAFVYLFVNQTGSTTLENIIIEPQQTIYSALLFVAQNQSLYAKNGLNVTLNEAATTINDLISNKCDFAVGSEFQVTSAIMANSNISAIATVDKSETVYLLARKDSGIATINDLVGKKIGCVSGSITNFYLDRYLDINGISKTALSVVNFQQPTPMVSSLVNGSIDAIVGVAGSVLNSAQTQLPNNTILLPILAGQTTTFASLVCQTSYITSHSGTVKSLLKALDEAATYTLNNPLQAQQIIQNKLNLTFSTADWQGNQFSLSLDQPLIIAMKDEAQWMINNHLTNQTQVPNFTDNIYTDGLKAIDPDAVTIIK